MRKFICVQFLAVLSVHSLAFAGAPPKMTPELVEKGKGVYTMNCVSCHGEKGDGNEPAGAYMNPKPRDFGTAKYKAGGSAEQLFKTVTQGLAGTSMPGFSYISEADRWAVVYYVQKFKK